MERREKQAAKQATTANPAYVPPGDADSRKLMTICRSNSAKVSAENQLWTARYAPQTLKEICGNKGQVEKLQDWLSSWSVIPTT